MITIKGYTIIYKPFNGKSRTLLHYVLFGRLKTINSKTEKYVQYTGGMLHKTPFIRLVNSKIFVIDIKDINSEELRIFADITIKESERELTIESLKTGEEYWRDMAKERGLRFDGRE